MYETSTQLKNEQTTTPAENLLRDIGRASFKGLSLTGDRLITNEPYVDGAGDERDFYVDVQGPNQRGQLQSTQIPFEDALHSLRYSRGY